MAENAGDEVKVCISKGNDMYEVYMQKDELKTEQSEPSFLASLLYYAADKVMDSVPSCASVIEVHPTEEGEVEDAEEGGEYGLVETPEETVPQQFLFSSTQITETSDKNAYHWSDEEVFLLVELVSANYDKFETATYSQKKLWRFIANQMMASGYTPSPDQCHSKWRSLKRTYRSMKAQSRRASGSRQDWPFMEAVGDIIGNKMKPSAVSSEEDDSDFDNLKPSKRSQIAQQKRKLTALVSAIKQINEENQRAKEKRHQERMAQRERLISLLKKLVS